MAYHRPARCSMGRSCVAAWKRACASWGLICAWRAPNPICAAALPGTYSVLQPEISHQLRDRKIAALDEPFAPEKPAAILSANMGCIVHLQNGTEVPVMHWVELLDQALAAG